MHLLQFVNYYASIIYAAFFDGMFVRSGGYDHLFGFRHEEDYEAGSDALNEAMKYAHHFEPVRTSLPSKLTAEQGLVGECLQGDLHNRTREKSLTSAPLNNLFSYKKPLVKHEAYATYKTWMGQSYHKQFLLPSTQVRKHTDESTTVKVLSSWKHNEKLLRYIMLNFAKFVRENSGKLMMLVLTTQVAAVQAFHNTTHVDLVSAGNATDSFSMIPIPAPNQASFYVKPKNTSDLAEVHQYVNISNHVLQKTPHQSNTIINDLQEIAKFLITNKDTNRYSEERSNPTTLPRVVRSLPIEESIMCEIEQDTLINLRNELHVVLEQPNERGSNICQLNFDSDRSEELINLVDCGMDFIISWFMDAKNVSEALILIRNKSAEFTEKYLRLLDDKSKFHTQECNQKIIKLKTGAQELQSLLNTVISMLKQRIESSISEISSGKIERAIETFKTLHPLNVDSILPTIIRSVYSEHGNLGQVDNIVNFIKKLPSCALGNIANTVLFDEMHKSDHLISPNVLIVAHAAESCLGGTFMKPYVRCVIDTWAYKVRINKDKESIVDFAWKHASAFNANLPDLINKAYANELSNVENIIMFVRELPNIQVAAIGFSSLFDNMISNGHVNSYQTLMLAYRIKEFMELPNYPNIQQNYKDMFNTLNFNLPNSVKGLIWSSRNSCTIFNIYYEEYLYAANYYFNYPSYTWVPGNEVNSCYWKLDMQEEGKFFKIMNPHHKRFLFSPENKFDSQRRHLRTETGGDGYAFDWRLEPEDDNFLIWSIAHDNYLYAENDKKTIERRYVFGWSPSSIPNSVKMKSRWRIAC